MLSVCLKRALARMAGWNSAACEHCLEPGINGKRTAAIHHIRAEYDALVVTHSVSGDGNKSHGLKPARFAAG